MGRGMERAEIALSDADLKGYFDHLAFCVRKTEVTDGRGHPVSQGEAVAEIILLAREAHARGRKLIFIGNGGSAAIASHMATDYSKNGNLRSIALNDGSMLTCLGNDLGYENVFAKQIELHAIDGDVLVAISSSGRSPNILKAVNVARARGCRIVTLSGFDAGNELRKLGDVNFYLNSRQYGFVEIGHLTICHAILDFACGKSVPQAVST